MSSRPPPPTDPIDAEVDKIAAQAVVGLDGLLPREELQNLEIFITVTLATQGEMRRIMQMIVASRSAAAGGVVDVSQVETPGKKV